MTYFWKALIDVKVGFVGRKNGKNLKINETLLKLHFIKDEQITGSMNENIETNDNHFLWNQQSFDDKFLKYFFSKKGCIFGFQKTSFKVFNDQIPNSYKNGQRRNYRS